MQNASTLLPWKQTDKHTRWKSALRLPSNDIPASPYLPSIPNNNQLNKNIVLQHEKVFPSLP
jgi:hypothetical protein